MAFKEIIIIVVRVAFASADMWDSSMMQLTAAVADTTSGSGTRALPLSRTSLSGGCSFKPVRCTRWCQQPAWNQHDGAGLLTCCSGKNGGLTTATDNSYEVLVAYLYSNEEEMLRQQVRMWAGLPADFLKRFRFLLAVETEIDKVRYINQEGKWAVRKINATASPPWVILKEELSSIKGSVQPDIHLVGIGENLEWNVGGKRNLLQKVANDWQPDGWVLLSDIDMQMSSSFMGDILKIAETSKDVINMFKRRMSDGTSSDSYHPGTLLMKSSLHWKMGGCDEDFVGTYGYTDPQVDLKSKLMHIPIVGHDTMHVHETVGGGVGEHVQQEGGDVNGHPRNRTRNRGIFYGKKLGQTPWSNDYLRFNWSLIAC